MIKNKKIKIYGDGIHDDTCALQAMLDKRGLVEVPEGRYLITKPLIIHDDTHLKLTSMTVLRLADGANCAILDNDGLYNNTVNRNITIEGGIWDGNNIHQKREFVADQHQPCDYNKYVSNSLLVLMIRLVHTERLTVKNIVLKDPTTYGIHIADVKYYTVENVFLDYNLKTLNMDGVHIQGPARFGSIRNVYGNGNDDQVAICTNGTTRSECTRGDIEDLVIDGVFSDNGYTGVRLLSCGDTLRNVTVKNVYGEFRVFGVSLTHCYPVREDMPILFENVHITNVHASKSRADLTGLAHGIIKDSIIWFEESVNCKNVLIENVYRHERNLETKAPTIQIDKNVTAENLKFRNIVNIFDGEELEMIQNNSDCEYTLEQ